ncbi:MAG: Mur ligase family protein [Steroidobacteraceae bacterium]
MQLALPGGAEVAVDLPLLGDFNLENLLVSVGIGSALGASPAQIAAGVASCRQVPGRIERVGDALGPRVIVDYAHTPDAIEKLLATLRPLCRGRFVAVFGCGGDRDPGKRSMMGAIAAELADEIILTDDNPRTEDPQQIIAAIIEGIPSGESVRVLRERARAISTALGEAGADDIVLIAGKGHEDYQIYGAASQPFSDRIEVQRLLGGSA